MIYRSAMCFLQPGGQKQGAGVRCGAGVLHRGRQQLKHTHIHIHTLTLPGPGSGAACLTVWRPESESIPGTAPPPTPLPLDRAHGPSQNIVCRAWRWPSHSVNSTVASPASVQPPPANGQAASVPEMFPWRLRGLKLIRSTVLSASTNACPPQDSRLKRTLSLSTEAIKGKAHKQLFSTPDAEQLFVCLWFDSSTLQNSHEAHEVLLGPPPRKRA